VIPTLGPTQLRIHCVGAAVCLGVKLLECHVNNLPEFTAEAKKAAVTTCTKTRLMLCCSHKSLPSPQAGFSVTLRNYWRAMWPWFCLALKCNRLLRKCNVQIRGARILLVMGHMVIYPFMCWTHRFFIDNYGDKSPVSY
jgi:hypothetical protein